MNYDEAHQEHNIFGGRNLPGYDGHVFIERTKKQYLVRLCSHDPENPGQKVIGKFDRHKSMQKDQEARQKARDLVRATVKTFKKVDDKDEVDCKMDA